MGIAIDQTRLRRITSTLLADETLDRSEAVVVLEIVRMAAGVDGEHPQEHATLQAVSQRLSSLAGLELDEASELPRTSGGQLHLDLLARALPTTGARELAYALALIVSVADLELVASERSNLQELQRALGVDDRRATDLTVFVVDVVAEAA